MRKHLFGLVDALLMKSDDYISPESRYLLVSLDRDDFRGWLKLLVGLDRNHFRAIKRRLG